MIWIIIAIVVVLFIVKSNSFEAAKMRNSINTFINDEEGPCCECKHCVKDMSRRFSNTDWYCSLSKCRDITPETRMNCFEKPTVTEEDLAQLFAMGIWTQEGKQYIRQSILGKRMTFSELDAFLRELPKQYPHYIDPEFKKRNMQ